MELEEEVSSVAGAASAAVAAQQLRDLSYSQQYDLLFQGELDVKKVRVKLLSARSSRGCEIVYCEIVYCAGGPGYSSAARGVGQRKAATTCCTLLQESGCGRSFVRWRVLSAECRLRSSLPGTSHISP